MTELARGSVTDRPWGRTLGTLGSRGLNGQVNLVGADGKRYHLAFVDGAVVAASSPMATDAAVRVAMTTGILSSTQVAEAVRRQNAAPQRDEIDVISELVRLGIDQSLRLRRRVVAQRAARSFSVDRGEFIVDDRVTLPVAAGTELDVRSVIFLGARANLSDPRLDADLEQFGRWFRLRNDAISDIPQFGFTDAERPVLQRLQSGATLDELELLGIEARVVRAMVYALASCNACEADASRKARAPTPIPAMVEVSESRRPTTLQPPRTRTPQSSIDVPTLRRSAPSKPPLPASTNQPGEPRRKANTAQAADVKALIAQRLALMASHVDHFKLLGVSIEATPDVIRKAYFGLARQLHPDRLSALGIPDIDKDAQRLFAQVNTAFAVLSDNRLREAYASIMRRGGEAAVRREQVEAERKLEAIVEAEECFRRGEMALRRDQLTTALSEFQRAAQLDPSEPDYQALIAWAQFCATADKIKIAPSTRTALERAIATSPLAVTARFYLGRVERMLGRDQDALRHFQEVLRIQPHHSDASSEARVIEARLASSGKRR
ncbi:MAG: DnaJ domain-containing protein [Kofleriaceae bacterium]